MPKLNNTTIILLVGAVVILAGLCFYFYYRKDKESYDGEEKQDKKPASAPSGGPGQPALVLFHATWCGHCKDFAPEWKTLIEKLKGSPFKTVDMESKDPSIAQHNIAGFPTIRFYPFGFEQADKYAEYKGDRTAAGVLDFIGKVVADLKSKSPPAPGGPPPQHAQAPHIMGQPSANVTSVRQNASSSEIPPTPIN